MSYHAREFWGKLLWDENSGHVIDQLSLVDHCLDVACVFRELAELPAVRRNLENAAGVPLDTIQLERLPYHRIFIDLLIDN